MSLIQTTPLHSDFAVQVHVFIPDILDNAEAMAELKAIWQKSPVMIFRRQSLDESELVRFSEYFGKCESTGRKDIQSPYHDEIIYFSTLKYSDGRFVGGFAGGEDVDWHSDQTYQVRPATGAILYGTEVPRDGGDIYWANQYAAWNRLPADIQQLIDGRIGTFRYAKRYAMLSTLELKGKEASNAMLSLPDARHPLVLTHPRTGRKALYVGIHLFHLDGFTEQESRPLIDQLMQHASRPEFTCRFRWKSGSLAFWDNRCTMHFAINDYPAETRVMHRVTVCGDTPY